MKPIVIKSTFPNWVAAFFLFGGLAVGAIWLAGGCSHVENIVENTQTVVSTAYSVISPESIDTIPLIVKDQYGSEYRFNVFVEGDSVSTDAPVDAMFGGRWWKCFAGCFTTCKHKQGEAYSRCISSCVGGCTIGDAILSVTCDLFPDKQQ